MKLDLHEIINIPGKSVPFDYAPDLADLTFDGVLSMPEPLHSKGRVYNSAGVLNLEAESDAVLECECARCTKRFNKPVKLITHAVLADEVNDDENADIYLLDGDSADVDEIIITDFVLNMDSRFLCREDCKGLCPRCGKDLNEGPCSCKPEIDPRLAVLAKLLGDKE